jgi:hypothetical protein
MNGAVPTFFLSYSRFDGDKYLSRFFEDLRAQVASVSGRGIDLQRNPNSVGFRDLNGVATGQDWMAQIGGALQRNGALVCVYSPNFFSRRNPTQFCGREFTAFLNRHPSTSIRYAPGTGEVGREFQLQGARNIVPILWRPLYDLEKAGFPPYVLRLISWALPEKLNDRYLEGGMWRMSQRRGATYSEMLTYFARRINDMAEDPLPPLLAPPDIEKLRNGFWDLPESDRIDHAAVTVPTTDDAIVSSGTHGPNQVEVIEVRRVEHAIEWSPYAGKRSIPALLEEVFNQKGLIPKWKMLDPSAAGFETELLSSLEASAKDSVRQILVVDPRSLADNTSRGALIRLLQQPCRAGFLVPADATDIPSVRLIEQYRALLQPAENALDWVVRISIGNTAQLQTAVTSVADDILARIVKTDPVRQSPPDNSGPATRPRIANQLDAERIV